MCASTVIVQTCDGVRSVKCRHAVEAALRAAHPNEEGIATLLDHVDQLAREGWLPVVVESGPNRYYVDAFDLVTAAVGDA